jgi:hypothetical protein
MTRGRTANTAHLVAADLAGAREQWIAVFGRDRADLGPGHAAELATREVARYAPLRPLDQVLAELHEAWTAEQRCLDLLALQQPLSDRLRAVVALEAGQSHRLEALGTAFRQAANDAERAHQQAAASGLLVTAQADQIREAMLTRWDAERNVAHQAARTVLAGPGWLGLHRAAVARAAERRRPTADARCRCRASWSTNSPARW